VLPWQSIVISPSHLQAQIQLAGCGNTALNGDFSRVPTLVHISLVASTTLLPIRRMSAIFNSPMVKTLASCLNGQLRNKLTKNWVAGTFDLQTPTGPDHNSIHGAL